MLVSDWMKENMVCRWVRSLWKCRGKAFLRLYVYAAVVYLPLIVLRLTNFLDGMWDQDDHLAGVAELQSGRWFWPYLDRLRFGVSLDPMPALLSIALYVIGVLVLISMMRKSGTGKLSPVEYLCAALMLTTPAVLCQLSYSYMSITFSTGFLFSVLAVWVIAVPCAKAAGGAEDTQDHNSVIASSSAETGGHGAAEGPAAKQGRPAVLAQQLLWILLAALFVALMMGLYQAFLGVTCIAALAFFIYQLDGTCTGTDCCFKKAFAFVLRMLIALAIGAALYQFLLQIHLTVMGQTLSSYKGTDSVSLSGILSALPSSLAHCFNVFRIYFLDTIFLSSALQLSGKGFYLFYLVPAVGVMLYVGKLLRAGKGVIRVILLAAAVLLIPVFATSFFLLATDSDTMIQMTSGLSLVLPLILLMWDRVALPGTKRTSKAPHAASAIGFLASIGMSLLLYGQIGQMEIDQYAMYAGRQATTTLAESIMNEYAVYGVDYQYNVVMVYGAPADSPTFVVGDLYYKANSYAQYGNWGNTEGSNRLCWYHFFRQQMRVELNYAEGDTLHNTMTSEQVQSMSVFPASGSVQNVWGVTVVKVAE